MKKIAVFLLLLTTISYSQDFAKGKELFNNNCAACHNMERKMTGPALKDVVGKQGREWTEKWIKNSAELIASGDTHANEVYKEYNEMAMPAYEFLPAEELTAIVDYLEGYSAEKLALTSVAPVVSGNQEAPSSSKSIPTYLIVLLIIIMLVVVVSIVLISKALGLLFSTFENTKLTNEHLMKKLNITKDEISKEVETLLEKEVTKRVDKKVKSLKTILSDKLKNFK